MKQDPIHLSAAGLDWGFSNCGDGRVAATKRTDCHRIHFGDPLTILLSKELRLPPSSPGKPFRRFCGGSPNVCADKTWSNNGPRCSRCRSRWPVSRNSSTLPYWLAMTLDGGGDFQRPSWHAGRVPKELLPLPGDALPPPIARL